jgi:hypothetical protein
VAGALFSLTKMTGARLNWRPSLFIDSTWALQGSFAPTRWTMAFLTSLAPCIVLAMWVKATVAIWIPRRWWVPSAVTATALLYTFRRWPEPPDDSYPVWVSTILIGSALLGLVCLVQRFRRI